MSFGSSPVDVAELSKKRNSYDNAQIWVLHICGISCGIHLCDSLVHGCVDNSCGKTISSEKLEDEIKLIVWQLINSIKVKIKRHQTD